MVKYYLPFFLEEKNIDEETYRKWLYRKAQNLHRRDRKYFEKKNKEFKWKLADYREAIHKAVCESDGRCFYTGEELAWEQISKFDGNEKIKNLPTVDHLRGRDVDSNLDFVITSWTLNDMKNDLNVEDFIKLCEKVVSRKREILQKFQETGNL
ncbi:hypothetical protein [Desulfurobacterium sp.]